MHLCGWNIAKSSGCSARARFARPKGNACLGSNLLRWLARSKSPLLVELRDPTLVVTERITQHLLRVLAQQRSSHRINRTGQAHGDRRLDVRDPLCRTMRNPVHAMALARLRCIEPLLD